MKETVVLTLVLSMLSAPAMAAQLYRSVDEKGNVEWRDTPPPPTAKKVEQRRLGATPAPTLDLPYSVQVAMKKFPVTLWVTDCGDTCDRARAHLVRRGVPHTEKDPRSDIEGFKKVSGGSLEVPLLFVGGNRFRGYHEPDWDAALDAAGYPKTALAPLKPKLAAPPPPPKPAAPAVAAVRLYTSPDCGENCDQAKALLAGRGITYQEIAVEDPPAIEELKKLSGDTYVPVLVVGNFMVQGYDTAAYHRALDQGGFQREQQAQP